MPHITIEYSNNLQPDNIKHVLNEIAEVFVSQQLVAHPNEIKGRAYQNDCFIIGLGHDPEEAYIYVKLALLTGRTPEQKHQLGVKAHRVVKTHFAHSKKVQICLEITEIEREFYFKSTT